MHFRSIETLTKPVNLAAYGLIDVASALKTQ